MLPALAGVGFKPDHFAAIRLPQERDHRNDDEQRFHAFAQQDRERSDEGRCRAGGIRREHFFSIAEKRIENRDLISSYLPVFGAGNGKPVGVFLGAYLTARFTRAELSKGVSWWDILGIGSLAGVGFTVSLLITELAFKDSPDNAQLGVIAVLVASLGSALIASVILSIRCRVYEKVA